MFIDIFNCNLWLILLLLEEYFIWVWGTNVWLCKLVLIYCEQIVEAAPVFWAAGKAKMSHGKKLFSKLDSFTWHWGGCQESRVLGELHYTQFPYEFIVLYKWATGPRRPQFPSGGEYREVPLCWIPITVRGIAYWVIKTGSSSVTLSRLSYYSGPPWSHL